MAMVTTTATRKSSLSKNLGSVMENIDVLVLRALKNWRQKNHDCLLVTVVRTWGSSPRPVGAVMAICDTGQVVGSVSGGCIEDDLIRNYIKKGVLAKKAQSAPQFIKYGISAQEAHQFGLPCGGTIELFLEFNPNVETLVNLVAALDQGQLVIRSVDVQSGHVSLRNTSQPEVLSYDGHWLHATFGPSYRMLLIGSGQLSEYLATMALFNGFEVTVCDPRKAHSGSWSVPRVKLVTGMPDDEVIAFKPDKRSCVIALTHDPKLDDLALLEALDSSAFYVGAIGSRRNSALRNQRMIEYLDQTPETLARLKSPIGIYIGSKTPSEIAVSIMAEIIAVKNKVDLPKTYNVKHAKDQSESELVNQV